MFQYFINKSLKIFVCNDTLFSQVRNFQFFNNSKFYVYTNSYYNKDCMPLKSFPQNQQFNIVIIDSLYAYNKLKQNNVSFNYLITDNNQIIKDKLVIDQYYGFYLYKIIQEKSNQILFKQNELKLPQLSQDLKNTFIPIFIRTKDRPYYLYTTLKSITGSDIKNTKIHIIDDCSTTQIAKKFLYSNQKISEQNFSLYDEMDTEQYKQAWNNYIGHINSLNNVYGIKDKFNVIKSKISYGAVHGLLYTIKTAFDMYPDCENIIILEDDLLFNYNWLNITKLIYSQIPKPFGFITLYKHSGYHYNQNQKLYQNIELQAGLMYFISRNLYNKLIEKHVYDNQFLKFTTDTELITCFNTNLCSDLFLLKMCKLNNLFTCTSKYSYIQHTGIKSICRPNRKFNIRCADDFIQPFTWNNHFQ